MGKRSSFERVERDFYPTPREAVLPLLPHLPAYFTFCEPCAGNAALTGHLANEAGGTPVAEYDIEPQDELVDRLDALSLTELDLRDAELIITNPPWDRKLLHPMIERFSDLRPTWLLFDADWKHTLQAQPFMTRLRKIVSVGRVKWIPDSKMTGKDNCAWYLFDVPGDEPATFHGRVKSSLKA